MKFDFEAARSAGYSDDEIADYLAKENNFDLGGALKSGYTSTEVINYLTSAPAEPKAEAAPVTKAEPTKAADDRGIVQRVKDFISPEYKSVMEGYQPTPQEQKASVEKRLSYGAGPISSQTAAKADLVRSGMAKDESAVVQKVAKAMDEQGAPSFGDIVSRAKQQQDLEANNASANRKALAEDSPYLAAVGSGAASSLAGAINIPTVAADFLNQSAVNPVLKAIGLPELERVPKMIGTEYLMKTASDYMPAMGRKSMQGAWNRDEFMPWLGVKLAANSMSMAQSLAAAFAPPLRAALLPSMGGTVAGQSYVEGDDSRVAVAKGAIEIGTEMLPLKAIDKIGDILKGMGPSKSSTVLAVAGQRLLQSGGVITANSLTNAIEESAAQLGGNTLDKYFQGKDIELTKGLGEAAVVGAAAGNVMSAPQVAGVATGAYDPATQLGREMQRDIDRSSFATGADQVARDLLNPNTYDPSIVSPEQTVKTVNFTPADSPSKQAGLVDIVVPVPAAAPVLPEIDQTTEQEFGLDTLRTGGVNVSTGGATQTQPAAGGIAGSDQLGGGVGVSGPAVDVTTGQLGGGARLPAADAQQTLATGSAAAQPATNLTAQNNNADTQPAEQWFGRKGDGYATQGDASQALGGRQRMFPSLEWKIEQMPNGKFRLAGYNLETTNGTQAPQAVQAEAQGQQQATAADTVAAVGAQAPAAPSMQGAQPAGLTLSDEDRSKLKATAPAPVKVISDVRNEIIKADGVEMSVVPVAEIDDQQRVAGALLRSLGKTLTVVRSESGPDQLSNGMINRLGGKHVFIAEDTQDAPLFVATHEAYHGLPADQRKALNTALLELFNEDQKDDFLKRFNYTADKFDEEAPAFMAQAISKRADFWEQLRTKLGDAEFVEVAKVILAKFKQILSSARSEYGNDFVSRYIKDVQKAQDLLSTAYAEAIKANQAEEQGATKVAASNRADIGAKLQERIDADFDGAVAEYSQLKGAEGGRLLDTDLVRELSPEYRADRTRAPEVHEASSAMTQRMFEKRVSEAPVGGVVAFMAGGGGAGKSSAQDLLGDVLSPAHTVLDGTLSGYEKARRNVQFALDNGQGVVIAYVYREPVEALRNGVLTRAMSKGRTVTLDALVKGHAGSSEVVRKLQAEFGDNEFFNLYVVDNSRGAGNAALVSLDDITPVIKSGLKEDLKNATDEEFQTGRISEAVYRSTIRGFPDARAKAQAQNEDEANRQGDEAGVQGRSGSVQQADALSGPVSKDEAVIGGVQYSSRARNLVDIPTIDLKDLVGKKVFGIKADLTDAGRSYTGIDGSQLEFPVEMMGGPNYVRLPENAKNNVVWAVRGGAVLTKILKSVEASDYVLVHAMNGNSHLTNSTISTAYLQTVEAYLRDGRISRENLLALDEIVRSPKNKTSLPDFPGFESPDIYDYIDGLSFNERGALAALLEKKEAQAHGLPNLDRFRRETIDQDFVGYRQGDAMLVLEVDKKNPTVKLGEEGTKMHPSYPLGLRGKVVGKLAKGINYEVIYRDYFENKVPTLANKEEGAWYTFDRATPIQEITPEIASSVSVGAYKAIKSARQAEAALAMANGNWLVSGKTKAEGGVSVQEFVDALRANDGAAALTMYDPKEVKAGIKDGSFRVYQLGSQGGDKGLKVFFGLKRGTPWYKDMIDGVGDNEVEVVSVTNNEMGATGVGIPAIITKAISEGATVLDAFAVKSKRFPDGFLPEMYSQFGFEEIGRVAFDPSYYDATQMADLKDFWSRGGWSEADGYPDVVVMRWKGNDEDRATAVERYVRSGETGVLTGGVRFPSATATDAFGQRDSARGKQARTRGGDRGQARGDQGASDAAPVVRRAYDSITEIASLSDGDIRNLGLNPSEVERLRSSLAGVVRSNRLAEPARGPRARSDESARGGSFTGIHYGKAAGLSSLSGTAFGTGIKGAEQARLAEAGVDPRIKKRVYFYLTNNNADMPRPEIGLGQHVYRATLGNMYDPANASQAERQRVESSRKTRDVNGFESAILDAGFRGYVNREQGTAVVLNADVPVAYEGVAEASKMRDRKPTRVQQVIETRTEGEELVRKPTNEEMAGIIKARPALAKVAPSFRLEFGEARVKQSEAEAADNALADAGASFQFGGVMASNRITDTPAFKRWFGDSKVVDAEGKPLVVYHGTGAKFTEFKADSFFAPTEKAAKNYGKNIVPVYLSFQKPKIVDYLGREDSDKDNDIEDAKAEGYDSLIIRNADDGWIVGDQYIAFSPTQIKSAIGNNGDFDASNPDITRSNRLNLAEDLAKQEEFLQRKAEEAGYKNIDEFVDNDYAGFVKAAEEWREENPADVMMAKRLAPSSNFLLERDELGNFKFKAGAMLYRSVADIASAVLDKTPFIGSLKPISPELSKAMRRMKAEVEQAREKTAGVAGKLGKLGEDEREMISDIIEGELKAGVKPPKRILQLAASMQSIMTEQTQELVRLGMLSADAAGRWDGKYLPRFYEQSLKKEATDWVKAAKALLGRKKTMQGISGSSLKGRGKFENVPVEELESWLAQGWEERDPDFDPAVDKEITIWRDYSKAEREKMGEIRDAMFRFVMGYMRSQKDIALGRLYEQLANTVATKKVTEGYVQVPTSNVEGTYTRRYGKLAGKYVPREVMDHLAAYDSNMEGDLLKMYRKALSMWKEGKTVLNPVAHANNVISNLTMAHFAGVSYWDANKYLGAVRELVKGDKMVKEARAAGLFGGTVSQEELVSMLPDQLKVLAAKTESKVAKGVDTVWSALSFFMRKPLGVAYEAEDLYFRYLIYRDARGRGMKPEDAVAYAQQFIFTYDDLPKGARTIRDAPIGIPFFSWTYKAIPVIARTALEYPWRFAAPAAVTYAVNAGMYAMAASIGGGEDDDWWEVIYRYVTDPEFRERAKKLEQQERRYLPEWMKGNTSLGTPKAIRLGTDDLTGLPVFLDASRMFPGGDLGDFVNNAGGVPLPAWLTPNNPVLTTMTAFLQNKDSFTGKEIVSNTLDTGGEKVTKWGEYAWRQFAPAVAPFNYHFDRTMNAIANATDTTIDLGLKEYTGVDKMGQPVQPKYAAMQTVGIKARPTDLEVSEQIENSKRQLMIRELDKQIRQINRLEGKDFYSEEKADKLREAVKEKRQRLKEGLTISGDEPQ